MRVFLICLLALGYGTGCATVINGTTQKIPVQSDPAGAKVVVNGGEQTATTPAVLTLKRKHRHIVTISAPGYETQNVTLSPELSGAVAGNLLLGGIIGGGVDLASGGANKLSPSSVNVTLLREGERAARAAEAQAAANTSAMPKQPAAVATPPASSAKATVTPAAAVTPAAPPPAQPRPAAQAAAPKPTPPKAVAPTPKAPETRAPSWE